jgi:acetylornithine deacetylase
MDEARAAIDHRAEEWSALLQDLVRIPSVFEHEHRMVERVGEHIAAMGLRYDLVPMDAAMLRTHPDAVEPISSVPGRNNVVARIAGAGGGRSLILNCHLDIVHEGDPSQWRDPPYSGTIDPERNIIYGRGAMDDKAGAAILLGLMRIMTEARLRFAGDLIFQFVLDDEITGNGTLACLEAGHVGDAAFIVDGTRLDRAIDRHAGSLEFDILFRGRPASVSVSHMGVNAAEVMSRILLQLREDVFALNAGRQHPWTQFPSPYQFVIHSVQADARRFTVPDEARARCFTTFPPPATLTGMRQYFEDKCRELATAMKLETPPQIRWNGFAAEPTSFTTDELRALLRKAVLQAGVADLQIGPSTGTSDLRHFANRGIPCMLYGPGRGFNPHRPDEHFHLDDLPVMMKLYLDIAAQWCGPAAP